MGKGKNLKLCPVCGKPVKEKSRTCCSYICAGKYRQNYKVCPICGKKFPCAPSASVVSTCGAPACKAAFRKALIVEGMSQTERMTKLGADFLSATPPEKLPQSKSWVLRAPNGVTYECVDLKKFVRENNELFDGTTTDRVCSELYNLKSSILGTNAERRRRSHWHGWEVLKWGAPNCKPDAPKKPPAYTHPSSETLAKKRRECETCNRTSKIALCSPDGNIYCPENLLGWTEENCETLFGMEKTRRNALTITSAFSRLKRLSNTTRKDGAPYHVYGGWTVIPCEKITGK